jgi:hypothetical protein
MFVLLTYVLCPRKKHVSHLTSAARLACSHKLTVSTCGIVRTVSTTPEAVGGPKG